jgi:hypothetical protein
MIRYAALLCALWMTSAPVAAADWIRLEVPDPTTLAAGETYFVDPDISNVGRWPAIHTLRNYRETNARGHASDSMVCEVDCRQQLIRAVGGTFYAGLMGKDPVDPLIVRTPWIRPAAGSALDRVLDYACSRQTPQ